MPFVGLFVVQTHFARVNFSIATVATVATTPILYYNIIDLFYLLYKLFLDIIVLDDGFVLTGNNKTNFQFCGLAFCPFLFSNVAVFVDLHILHLTFPSF